MSSVKAGLPCTSLSASTLRSGLPTTVVSGAAAEIIMVGMTVDTDVRPSPAEGNPGARPGDESDADDGRLCGGLPNTASTEYPLISPDFPVFPPASCAIPPVP